MDKLLIELENTYPLAMGSYTDTLSAVSYEEGITRIDVTNYGGVAMEIITTFTLTQEQCQQLINALQEGRV